VLNVGASFPTRTSKGKARERSPPLPINFRTPQTPLQDAERTFLLDCLVCLVYLVEPENQMNETNQTNQCNHPVLTLQSYGAPYLR
jgi:hypothetical protein